jgi:hypothetical protein
MHQVKLSVAIRRKGIQLQPGAHKNAYFPGESLIHDMLQLHPLELQSILHHANTLAVSQPQLCWVL